MARFVFFLLLIANVALGAYLYLAHTQAQPVMPPELNRDALKIVGVADPAKAQQKALAARKLASSLNGASCIDFGVRPADSSRAQLTFAAMNPPWNPPMTLIMRMKNVVGLILGQVTAQKLFHALAPSIAAAS